MKRPYLISFLILSSSLIISCSNASTSSIENKKEDKTYIVRFISNIPNVKITLSSKYEALADSILFESQEVKENEKVAIPNSEPIRNSYIFKGWYTNSTCTIQYDFESLVTSNINLYAKWERDNSTIIDDFVEPSITFKEIIDDNISSIKIEGVLNSKVKDNEVNLTSIGLKKLTENPLNVKELLNYSINSACKIASAIYENKQIIVTLNNNETIKILVNDISAKKALSNKTYEKKANNYESNSDIKPYSVILAGSSSMENWSSSSEDMKPLTTLNVGIGGTTVEQWNNSLAERLIYPFSPREVVLYVGINNIINSKNTGKETGNALIELFDSIHEHLPNTTIFYTLMNLIPNYMTYKEHIEEANKMALEYGNDKEYMKFIDAGSLLMKENNIPNKAYFLSDGLHMSLFGYTIWGQKVKNSVIEFEKEKYYGA